MLPELENLCIVDLKLVTDEVFFCIPNLTHLNCAGCTNVGDAGLIRLIQSSEMLADLNVPSCKVTNELIKAAIVATKKRQNNVVLLILTRDSGIDLNSIENTSPFLRLALVGGNYLLEIHI